jgi:endo-1,4-beta-D-glucanase Y
VDKSISFNHFFTITKVIVMIISELAEPFFLQRDLKRFLPLIVFLFLLMNSGIHAQNKPFPQQVNFPGCIKPSNVTQIEMNETIIDFYQKWKSKYLKKSDGGEIGKGYYINMKGTGGSGTEVTTSEAHGYGMIIFALMAGFDDSARIYYDGMVNLYDLHRSTINNNLMSWVIDPANGNSDGATDGDMDIAYSFLLASNQWGNDGIIQYKAKTDSMINLGLKGDDVRKSGSKRTTLGDWDGSLYNTRSSDWMADHMRAYYSLTKDLFWLEAADTIYSLINQISFSHSTTTGLMPDFVVDKIPTPAKPDFLEAQTDGDYSWNACRFPWRIAVDYAHYGTATAKEHLNKMLNWLKNSTNNNPEKIVAGYKLDGSKLVNYSDMAFTAPFIAACVCDATHQEYLNKGWSIIKKPQGDYYGDSIALLCLLFISGNWWKADLTATNTPSFSSAPHTRSNGKYKVQIRNSILTVQYNLPSKQAVRLTLSDISGRIFKKVQMWNHGSFQTAQFDLNTLKLQSGIYLMKISSPTVNDVIKINYTGNI